MANGASFIETLMALNALGQQPISTAPIPTAELPPGGLGPLSLETTRALAALNPEPVPPPLPQAPDLDAIRARILAAAGPELVAPTIAPASTLEQIATALQGFSAGVQGQGPQFVESVRERRERPIREFEARRRERENITRQLALTAEEAATRAQERFETQTNRLLEAQFERQVEANARRLRLQEGRETEEFRDLLLRKRQREEFDRETAAEAVKQQKAFENAKELAKLQSGLRREEIKTRQAGRGGGTAGISNTTFNLARRAILNFEAAKQATAAAVRRGDLDGERQARRRMDTAFGRLAQFPELIEAGFGEGGWPFAKVKTAQGSVGLVPQPQAGQAAPTQGAPLTAQDVQEFATINKISIEEARRQLTAQGAVIR